MSAAAPIVVSSEIVNADTPEALPTAVDSAEAPPSTWNRPVTSLEELQSASALLSASFVVPEDQAEERCSMTGVLPQDLEVFPPPPPDHPAPSPPCFSSSGSRIVSGLILRTNSIGHPQQQYSYPVATMLRDFVRTSLSSSHGTATTSTASPNPDDTTLLPLSVRSEEEILAESRPGLSSDPRLVQSDPRLLYNAATVRPPEPTVLGEDEDEYYVVDGDLIAVSTSHTRRRHSSNNSLSLPEQLLLQANMDVTGKACQPKKMRRGIRKLSKIFSRRGRHKHNKKEPPDHDDTVGQAPIELSLVDHAAPILQSTSLIQQQTLDTSTISLDTTVASQPSPVRRGSAKPPKKEKKLRWGRRVKTDPRNAMLEDAAALSGAFSTTDSNGGEMGLDALPPDETEPPRRRLQSVEMPVTTGLEPPSWGDEHQDVVSPDEPHTPRRHPFYEGATASGGSRTTSVTASYVGTAELLVPNSTEDGLLLPDASVAVVHFEDDPYDAALSKKEDDYWDESAHVLPLSLVPEQMDLKVDKADAPDVEDMLRRAVYETATDFDRTDSDGLPHEYASAAHSAMGHAKDDYFYYGGDAQQQMEQYDGGVSVPLSVAHSQHAEVHNDTLKVVMVSASSVDKSWIARRLRNCDRRPRARTTLAVDVHEWQPPLCPSAAEEAAAHAESSCKPPPSPVKCTIWDVQGATPTVGSSAETRSNFGAHPGTQSLFFSSQSLYLLCWDLACNNTKTNRMELNRDDDDSDFDDEDEDDEDYEDDFAREEANRHADRALHADIVHRVLSWFDCIARCGPKSAIVPVALVSEGMTTAEIKRRCDMMRIVLEDHFHRLYEHDNLAPKLLTGTESSIVCVNNFGEALGIQQLQEMVAAIANDPSHSVFDHVGTPVPHGTVLVREAIQRFKEEHKLILLDQLLGYLGNSLELHEVVRALQFLACIGDILYYGSSDEDVLARYIILSRKWLVSALSCILRNDLKRELIETRRFMNMQCIYSNQKFVENEITAALVSGKSSSCPLLSDEDAKMLWQSMSFMREASDRYSNLLDQSTTIPTMFYFLERLLVHAGVFLPLGAASSPNASLEEPSEVFFVPSLLSQADPTNLWTYMTTESWMTTLCHSWLFRDGAPPNLMEHVTVHILRDLYEFAAQSSAAQPSRQERVHSAPVRATSWEAAAANHDTPPFSGEGRVQIHHVVCFQSSMLVKIGTVFADDNSGHFRESFVEVFVAVVDQTSAHTVASDVMRPCMQRIVVSGKGQVGRQGHKLWHGGYQVVLQSVQKALTQMSNLDAQTICPECLATGSPRIASTWSWDVVRAAALSGNPHVICLRGHRVNSHLICGTPGERSAPDHALSSQRVTRHLNIKDALPSVVLIGVWDPSSKSIISVGSGCIVDKKAGLIVTAGHVIFDMENHSKGFGQAYFGCPRARAVVAVIPDRDQKHAVFRYFADIVAYDVRNVDACVLQIRSRMERDVDDTEGGVSAIDQQGERPIGLNELAAEDLRSLKLTKHFDLAEPVRLLGYSQEGEGLFVMGRHISPSVEFVEGRIRRLFKAQVTEENGGHHSDSSSAASMASVFAPREEIVLDCLVQSGHSGGPCINGEGKVVGILSRSDPGQRNACYLVPTSELKPLIMKAKSMCMPRPARLTSHMQTM